MKRRVKLFTVPGACGPGGPVRPAGEFAVEAETMDGLREAVRDRLIGDGYRVRSISFGPEGLVAYAEEPSE